VQTVAKKQKSLLNQMEEDLYTAENATENTDQKDFLLEGSNKINYKVRFFI
jgi:hypothetical protein